MPKSAHAGNKLMRPTKKLAVVAAFVSMLPLALHAQPQTAQGWFDASAIEMSNRFSAVEVYVERLKGGTLPGLNQSMGANAPKCTSQCRVYSIEEVIVGLESAIRMAHLLSPMEAYTLAGVGPDAMELSFMSAGYAEAQDALAANAAQMLGPWAGIATMVFGEIVDADEVEADIESRSWEASADGPGDPRETPWLNPFRMLGAGAVMFSDAARSSAEARMSLGQSGNQAQGSMDLMASFLAAAELMGIVTIDGKSAMHISAPVPEAAASEFAAQSGGMPGDASFVPETSSVWIEVDTYAILKHRMDGIASKGSKSRAFYIENANEDYRQVPGSDMYMPYKHVMRMGGVMDEKQMAEMKEAQKQLEDFDKEMAAMPPDQRKMVEDMMGGQMEALRGMASTGAFQYVEQIDEILVNPDLKALFTVSPQGVAGPPDNLLPQIQSHLTTIGYSPGNTNGVLDTTTQVAISQYEAENGLQVTGAPSQGLLDALTNSVANQ